ncbi:DUF2809 domain-containing protein [Pontibacter harenae]|uniref:ribosomal maturation YjgA family protein n=1 Tax=Pontibacter harenae TaxID=2894083 RepID=UPI001E34E5D3|nr:DUF2809 domain-containing protein [Pontibacter harenae]MCC9168040.1 DUF2809 domain-containing protein [Pontibacter harenae]
MFTFNKKYFFFTVALFLVEVLIAGFVHDAIVRPYVGDFLVVMLIYCFVKSFVAASVGSVAAGALIFAYLVELLQYLNFIVWLGLKSSKLANVVLGNQFEWIDMLAYTLGALAIVGVEKLRSAKLRNSTRSIAGTTNDAHL